MYPSKRSRYHASQSSLTQPRTGTPATALRCPIQSRKSALQSANSDKITNCTAVKPDKELFIPLTCATLYVLHDADTCESMSLTRTFAGGVCARIIPGSTTSATISRRRYGSTGGSCVSRLRADSIIVSNPIPGVVVAPGGSMVYSSRVVAPPEGSEVAGGTTPYCGKWYTVSFSDETCAAVCSSTGNYCGSVP
ncbi:hypothetical protein BJX68DRAFT_264068 [Aspergillus pseudodeflectus]|uniref:Uncharacterized protein n=1 Tax=Aspergillus pseudodeflectus TaxID=176178 RepID=A0ABR4KTV0_9EURO